MDCPTKIFVALLLVVFLPAALQADEPERSTIELADGVAIDLVRVPAGKFQMGADPDDPFRIRDGREDPRHEVTVSRPFDMSVCEISRGQFAAFIKESGYRTQAEREGWAFAWNRYAWDKVAYASWRNPGFEQTDEHPVICVSFDDAVAFCRWLSEKSGRAVRLPTEAQYEYAARAGADTSYPWGDEWEEGEGWANAADKTARETYRGWRAFPWTDGYLFTSPVGSYRANKFGLKDMTGNVWEWCADRFGHNYYKTSLAVDPLGPETGHQRVIRGGSWLSSPPRCRVAGRAGCDLRGWYCDYIIGFRVVIEESDDVRPHPTVSMECRTDWPQFRGPRRDGVSMHVPENLPERFEPLWQCDTTGPGHSGIAVSEGRVIFADKSADDADDIWRCVDAETGEPAWTLQYEASGAMDYTNSPRATPVIYDGRVYLLGALGHLHCVDLETGRVIWRRHLADDFDAKLPKWGYSATPLVIDELLIVNPGAPDASLVGLNRYTGQTVWKNKGSEAAYASLVPADFAGRRQIIGYTADSLCGWCSETGGLLWEIEPEEPGDFNVPTPIPIRDELFVATENNSARLYNFAGRSVGPVRYRAQPDSRFDDLAPDMVSPVAHRGMIFGAHNASLYCLDAESLELLWKSRDRAFYGFTTLIAGEGRVLIISLHGDMLLVGANREKYELISRLQLFPDDRETEVWSHAAIVAGKLYVRSGSKIACLKIE